MLTAKSNSPRNLIVTLIEEYQSTIKVARALNVAPNTVRWHLKAAKYAFNKDARKWELQA